MESTIYNAEGKKVGTLALPEALFGVKWNDALMHQVVTTIADNARTPVAHTKTRGDVRGGGKKPWAQKGTGRARHGSIRSPIWRGGGVTHGPRKDKSYARALPKAFRTRALAMALSKKIADHELVFVNSFGIESPKTALAQKVLTALSKTLSFTLPRSENGILIALSDPNEAVTKSFRNIAKVSYANVRDLNALSVLKYRYLIVENPEAALMILEHRFAKKTRGGSADKEAPKRETKKDSKKKPAHKTSKNHARSRTQASLKPAAEDVTLATRKQGTPKVRGTQ